MDASNNIPILILMFALGALLAALYLISLWFTVRGIRRGRHPALWLLTSLILRMGLLVIVFYFIVGDGQWERLLAALAGFITLRTITLRRVRQQIPAGLQKIKSL